jgi:selenocysteine-specific elongation factor
MVEDGSLRRAGTTLAAAGRAPALSPEHTALADLLADAGTRPPAWDELARRTGLGERRLRALLADLTATGRAVPAGEMWFDADALEAAVGAARAAIEDRPMRLSELRDLWGCGRRHALEIAEHMDRAGISRRAGEARVPAIG